MKKFFFLIALAILGLVCGVIVGAFNTGLVPSCGDPCSSRKLGSSAMWGLALMAAFPIIGAVTLKKIGNTTKNTGAVALGLSFLTLLPAAANYGFKLHQIYQKSPATLGVPDFDYSYMAIATKPVTATYGNLTVKIKPWERCVFGPVHCEKKPPDAEAMCLGARKVVAIKESDWPIFQRIPEEDMQALLDRPTNMRMCGDVN